MLPTKETPKVKLKKDKNKDWKNISCRDNNQKKAVVFTKQNNNNNTKKPT